MKNLVSFTSPFFFFFFSPPSSCSSQNYLNMQTVKGESSLVDSECLVDFEAKGLNVKSHDDAKKKTKREVEKEEEMEEIQLERMVQAKLREFEAEMKRKEQEFEMQKNLSFEERRARRLRKRRAMVQDELKQCAELRRKIHNKEPLFRLPSTAEPLKKVNPTQSSEGKEPILTFKTLPVVMSVDDMRGPGIVPSDVPVVNTLTDIKQQNQSVMDVDVERQDQQESLHQKTEIEEDDGIIPSANKRIKKVIPSDTRHGYAAVPPPASLLNNVIIRKDTDRSTNKEKECKEVTEVQGKDKAPAQEVKFENPAKEAQELLESVWQEMNSAVQSSASAQTHMPVAPPYNPYIFTGTPGHDPNYLHSLPGGIQLSYVPSFYGYGNYPQYPWQPHGQVMYAHPQQGHLSMHNPNLSSATVAEENLQPQNIQPPHETIEMFNLLHIALKSNNFFKIYSTKLTLNL
ncbi:hypothetical protein RFI_24714 [Reticulomyxa filosa]|uniref:Uncharacterized protein n=1 Tax=Reticulomyxa filosa TaxID=46433 RepID=X6MHW7_RETFI|nr:hypothetical protein RFI_24714 [Reticulomyxa filosa]|eukprot:ETO12660.1 hypothetical protein RFI_24714 [Reticulomyxa filosa]